MKNSNLRFFILFLIFFLFIKCDSNANSEKNSRKYSISEINSMLLKAEALYEKGDFENALANYKDVEKRAIKANYKKGVVKAYLEIAFCYYNLDTPNEGSHYLFLAEKHANENPEIMVKVNLLKAFILFKANSYLDAEKKFENLIEYAKKSTNRVDAVKYTDRSYINIGNINFHLENYNTALSYYYKGFASPDIPNSVASSINIAEIFLITNKIDSAMKYLQIADSKINRIPEKRLYIVIKDGYNGVQGLYFIKKGEYGKAIKLLRNNKSSTTIYKSEELLGIAYAKIGQTDSSSYFFQKNLDNKMNYKRIDLNTFKASSIISNDEKIVLENKRKQEQKTYFGFIVLSVLLILALIFMIYYRHNLNKQRTRFLEFEKDNLKMEKELSYLKQEHIQKQILAKSIQLEQKNKFIEELRYNLKNDKDFNLSTYFKNEQFIDKDLSDINDIIKEIHPNFFKELNDAAQTKLSNLDIKYAAFIYMNMDNSRIAAILKVDPKTVSVTKYRLKKKLGLNKEIDLEDYIRGM